MRAGTEEYSHSQGLSAARLRIRVTCCPSTAIANTRRPARGALSPPAALPRPRFPALPGFRSRYRPHRFRRSAMDIRRGGIVAVPFHDFDANPDTRWPNACRQAATPRSIPPSHSRRQLLTAPRASTSFTNGGSARLPRRWKAARPPLADGRRLTTAGTGSDVRAALISDAETHEKMACGDAGAAFAWRASTRS